MEPQFRKNNWPVRVLELLVLWDLHFKIVGSTTTFPDNKKILADEFQVFLHTFIFFMLADYYHNNGFKAWLESFWRLYRLKPLF